MTRNTPHLGPGATYGPPATEGLPSNSGQSAQQQGFTAQEKSATQAQRVSSEPSIAPSTASSTGGEQPSSTFTAGSDVEAFKSHFNFAESKDHSPPDATKDVPANEKRSVKTPTTHIKQGPLLVERNIKRDAVKAGNFHASSRQISLADGRHLKASCADKKGKRHDAKIDLNDCLTNTDGKILWAKGGNFRASARNIKLEQNGSVLVCEAGNRRGGWVKNRIELHEKITNENGVLKMM